MCLYANNCIHNKDLYTKKLYFCLKNKSSYKLQRPLEEIFYLLSGRGQYYSSTILQKMNHF